MIILREQAMVDIVPDRFELIMFLLWMCVLNSWSNTKDLLKAS